MVRDTIVASKHQRCDKAEKLFRLYIERSGFICPRVEREESIDDEIVFAEYLRVHALAEFSKLLE